MKNIFLTLLIFLLAVHMKAQASDLTTEAPTHNQKNLKTSPSESSIDTLTTEEDENTSDVEDTCEWENERQLETCLNEKAELAESNLNSSYKEIMATLNKESQNALRKEERSWIKWREAKCMRQAKNVKDCVNGCGVSSTMNVVCMTREAKNRAQQMKNKWNP